MVNTLRKLLATHTDWTPKAFDQRPAALVGWLSTRWATDGAGAAAAKQDVPDTEIAADEDGDE